MIGFGTIDGKSPVAQDFIWLAEYYDGKHLAEFDFRTQKENSFYDIKLIKLIRFGLLGHGMKLYFESDGVFNLNGRSIDLIYRNKDGKEYYLTGHYGAYKDIITYKDAECAFHSANGLGRPTITQYNVGYKAEVVVDGITFNIKPIIKVPYSQPVYLNLWVVADKKLNGELVIRVNNRESLILEAPLKKGVGGEVNWIVG